MANLWRLQKKNTLIFIEKLVLFWQIWYFQSKNFLFNFDNSSIRANLEGCLGMLYETYDNCRKNPEKRPLQRAHWVPAQKFKKFFGELNFTFSAKCWLSFWLSFWITAVTSDWHFFFCRCLSERRRWNPLKWTFRTPKPPKTTRTGVFSEATEITKPYLEGSRIGPVRAS